MKPEIRLELQRLLSALCDQEITAPEFARLEELLGGDAACRQIYVEYLDMHAHLMSDAPIIRTLSRGDARPVPVTSAPKGEPNAAPAPRKRSSWLRDNFRQGMLVTGTLAASLLVQVYFWAVQPTPEGSGTLTQPNFAKVAPDKKPNYVATLVHTVDCVWEQPQEPLQNGTRLASGKFKLAKGISSIRFDSGPELVVQGPAVISLDSSASATVLSGKVVFRSADADVLFDLRTPKSTLFDIGTEFAVSVTAEAEEVHVFEGEVQRVAKAAANPAESENLKAGESRRYESSTAAPGKPAQLDATHFVRHVVEPDQPPLDPNAGLLTYEGFAYANPSMKEGRANGGKGWASPWKSGLIKPAHKGDSRFPLNVKETLQRPNASAPGVGGSFDYTGFASAFRKLAQPIRLDTDGVYYLSFLFRRHGTAPDPLNVVSLRLWTNSDYEAQNYQEFRKRLSIGIKGSNQLFTNLQRMNAQTSMPLSQGTTYLLVAKIAASRSKPDQVFLRVYSPEESIETDETAWSVQSPSFRSDQVFEWVELHINSKSRQTIDELRVGTTWASVTSPWMAAR